MDLLELLAPPRGVVGVDARGVPEGELDELFPSERARLSRAGERRRREFVAARRCARDALRRLGAPAGELDADERGAPGWPPGVVGSITHTDAYRACVVGRSHGGVDSLRGLGLDAEPARPIEFGLDARIVTPPERDHQRTLRTHHPALPWGRVLFTAKEAIYKAWWPQTRLRLGFRSGGVGFTVDTSTVTSVAGSLTVTLYPPHLGRLFHGRWVMANGLVVALVADPWPGLPEHGWDPRLERSLLAA